MKRYIIIKCPKFSKLFDNILGVKDIVPINLIFESKIENRNVIGTVSNLAESGTHVRTCI